MSSITRRSKALIHAAGYTNTGVVSGFLRGDPEPVITRDGDELSLTSRGRWAADFFDQHWLPQLRTGTVEWPTHEAKQLIDGEN
jgi:hypothetical protein